MADNNDAIGNIVSPGGFVFGVQGWTWGEPRPRSITFFLDGTAMVCDQHGRPIRGTTVEGKEVLFATSPPTIEFEGHKTVGYAKRKLTTHAEIIAALAEERIDWRQLACAGWPQLPYDQLKEVYGDEFNGLPCTPLEELRKIGNAQLRKDALRARRERDDLQAKEMAGLMEE